MTSSSLMPVQNGFEKSTSALRAGVMVRLAAAMSPRPCSSAGSSWSRETGMNTTCTRRWRRLSLLLRNASNAVSVS